MSGLGLRILQGRISSINLSSGLLDCSLLCLEPAFAEACSRIQGFPDSWSYFRV